MKYNKLVRDNIPQILQKHGSQIKTYICDDNEYIEKLRKKLQEEVAEFLQDETIEELADILEVIYSLAKHKKTSKQELETIRKEKLKKRGGFDKKIVLVEATTVSLPKK